MTNILVVGDGAIGLLLSRFLSTDNNVYVLTRKSTSHTRFYSNKSQAQQKINARFIVCDELPSLPKFTVVLFTVKAFQVHDAFMQVMPYLTKHCAIVLSHNGMGNVETLLHLLCAQQAFYFLTTSMAGYKSNDYRVHHTGNGKSVIGGCNELGSHNVHVMLTLFKGIPQLSATTRIQQLRFEKLLVNIAINPLTALYNIKNGQLRAPQYALTIMSLLYESKQVANALGLNVTLVDALNNAYHVMTLTAENYSSMQQDIANNRPTEIQAICGYISEQGQRFNIKTPTNDELLAKIKAKKSVV